MVWQFMIVCVSLCINVIDSMRSYSRDQSYKTVIHFCRGLSVKLDAEISDWKFYSDWVQIFHIQADLVIRGLFICGFAYPQM